MRNRVSKHRYDCWPQCHLYLWLIVGNTYLTVTNTDTGASIDVTATDNWKVYGDSDLYLSTGAFEALNAGTLNDGTLNITWARVSSSSSSSFSVASSSSVSVSSSSADSSSPTSISVAEAITPAPTFSASSAVASTSTSTSVASSTSSSASAAATGSSSNGWNPSQPFTGQNRINYFTASSEASVSFDVVFFQNLQMMIFDIVHMRTGCGTPSGSWAAELGPLEAKSTSFEVVNEYIHNLMSIYTSKGCSITQNNVSALINSTISVAFDLDCYAYADQDQTCAATSTQTNSYGSGFNAQGGTCVVQIIDSGIYINYWAQETFFLATNCAIGTYFTDLALVIDSNLSGTFTEGVWSTSGASGQQTSCVSSTEYSTAASYVQNVGSDFSDAY
ncbi:hypothetical protein BT96DRAFT_1022992 [Gymnopus androsaceus JB14]|uniref:Uncharacterized protein n=1 Tax=Gymnopus androsaceus JB14 TaxID=1447944 RepID=A0A6A4H8I8_9AGAR|nr:hypothetical protein BT96DRAFT_1022992 [Gymnopus androsaceus JB14]